MRVWSDGGLEGHVFGEYGPVVYANLSAEDAHALWTRVRRQDWTLISLENAGWNADLSPWPAKAVFRGQPDFAGGAQDYLAKLESTVPALERETRLRPEARYILGYSMAGLFAVYAAMRSPVFDGFASVSGSLWYEGFLDCMREACVPERAYFSVGDREKLGRNPAFRTIEERTCEAAALLSARGCEVRFVLRPGGHFDDPTEWLARAAGWLLDESKGE